MYVAISVVQSVGLCEQPSFPRLLRRAWYRQTWRTRPGQQGSSAPPSRQYWRPQVRYSRETLHVGRHIFVIWFHFTAERLINQFHDYIRSKVTRGWDMVNDLSIGSGHRGGGSRTGVGSEGRICFCFSCQRLDLITSFAIKIYAIWHFSYISWWMNEWRSKFFCLYMIWFYCDLIWVLVYTANWLI